MSLAPYDFLASSGNNRVFHAPLADQSFAHYERNTLRSASPMLGKMSTRKTLVILVGENIRRAFEASAFDSYRALAKAAGVAPNTVRNLAEPEARLPGPRGETAPRLDNLDKIAHAMGYEGWQLMQETFDPANPPTRVLSKSEAEWHRRIKALYNQLPPDPDNGA